MASYLPLNVTQTLDYTNYTIYIRVLQTPHDFLNFRITACYLTQLWQMMSIAKLQIMVMIGLHLDQSLAKFLNHSRGVVKKDRAAI